MDGLELLVDVDLLGGVEVLLAVLRGANRLAGRGAAVAVGAVVAVGEVEDGRAEVGLLGAVEVAALEERLAVGL